MLFNLLNILMNYLIMCFRPFTLSLSLSSPSPSPCLCPCPSPSLQVTDDHLAIVNVSPIEKYHFLLVPNPKDCLPQVSCDYHVTLLHLSCDYHISVGHYRRFFTSLFTVTIPQPEKVIQHNYN